MKIFTTIQKHKWVLLAIAFWLLLWSLLSLRIGESLLLVSPWTVGKHMVALMGEWDFWQTVAFSFVRIVSGFFLALFTGVVLAAFSFKLLWLKNLLSPLMSAIKATPVASFIILVLIWVSPVNLSVLISFLMVLPIVYGNVAQGIENTNPQLLEAADVFRVPTLRKIRYIYLSEVMPYLRAACASALGLAWKAGIAAEVIGVPGGSIGERLYEAKIYLNTGDLFAWTVLIVCISVLFEMVFLALLDRFIFFWERM